MRIDREYLTIAEFAEYKKVTIKTIKRLIRKGKISVIKGKGKTKYRASQNYIHYTQLSTTEAQERFLKDKGLLPSVKKEMEKDQVSLTSKQEERQGKSEAAAREYIEAVKGVPWGRKGTLQRHVADKHKINPRTLERHVSGFLQGGRNALVPGWCRTGSGKKLIDSEIAKFIENTYLQPFGPSIKETHERLTQAFNDKRQNLPVYRTVADFINKRWTHEQQLLIRNKEEWDRRYSPHVRRDWSKVGVNEVWFGDAKQIDVACFFRDKPIFAWFTAFLDACSQKFVGWIFTPVHDRLAIGQAFDYAIAEHGTPKTVYIDRGKTYKSYLIAGGKLRKGKVINLFNDMNETIIPGIFRDLGSEVFYASPYNAREKLIEPNFKIFTQRLRHLPGYRGHSVKTRPKKLDQEIKARKLLSFEELSQEINKIINERNARPHSRTNKSPNSYYQNFTAIIPSENIRTFLKMDQNFPMVRDSTISIGGLIYRHDELWRLAGETVEARRDPKDIRRAAIIYKNQVFCFASLETPSHYRDALTLESVKTTARIRRKISKFRKAVIENEQVIDDPLKFAMELDQKGKLRQREIRPPSSKVRSLHQKEKLAKEVTEGLKNQDIDQDEREAVAGGRTILSRLIGTSKNKEVKGRKFRLVKHLTINDPIKEE